MTPEETLALAQQALRTPGGYSYTNHFLKRMADRDAEVGDIKRAIRTATSAERQPNGSWRLHGGVDSDDIPLVPVIDVMGKSIRLVTILD